MNDRSLQFKWTDLNRLRTIVGVVFESGGDLLIQRLRLKYFIPFGFGSGPFSPGVPRKPP